MTEAARYDEQILSDLHKDARGYRPREGFYNVWRDATVEERNAIWDGLIVEVEREIELDKQADAAAIEVFERQLNDFIRLGAKDRNEAVRWYVNSMEIDEEQIRFYGASWICYEAGLPYSMAQVFLDAGVTTVRG